MKNLRTIILALTAVLSLGIMSAQEESPFSVGVDVVSNYVWRGSKVDDASIQPCIEYSTGGFTLGTWGSWSFTGGTCEADLYASYGFDFGLSIGVTDYYYQGTKYFEYSTDSGAHAFELNAGYEFDKLSLSANYILNESAGAGSEGGDLYFEAAYAFKHFDVFVGAGDGWHTSDGDFMVCNIGIGTSKEVKITDSYSLPVFGQVVVNPEKEEYNIVVGISF